MKLVGLSILLLIGACSCQSSRELHYFKEGGNYYRLNIKQHAFLSSSRYVSGYFDEEAVNYYFGDVKRSTTKIEHISPSGCKQEDSDLVLILSTNSDVVSQEISGLAQNQELFALLNKLSLSETTQKIADTKSKLYESIESNDAILDELSTLVNSTPLSDESNRKTVDDALGNLYNTVAVSRGQVTGAKTAEDIQNFLLNGLGGSR